MIDSTEIEAVAVRFGAPEGQIVRDHLISHVLHAMSTSDTSERLTFIGGTALCRTCMPDLRLSEDIDLMVDKDFTDSNLRQHVSRQLRREFPNLQWHQLDTSHGVSTWEISSGQHSIRCQFINRPEWAEIPAAKQQVQLRYSDLPKSVQFSVPTPSGFAAMKLMAWFDRNAPRDLYDLAALAIAGHIDAEATQIVRLISGYYPNRSMLGNKPPTTTTNTWKAQLGHQLSDTSTAQECFDLVRTALVFHN